MKPISGPATLTHAPGAPNMLAVREDREANIQKIQEDLPPRYRLLRLVGRGGMGVVYQCLDSALDRTVAIKLMSDRYGTDPTAQKRFLREARAQAIINHPNVAKIQNVGVSQSGCPFLVMEFVEGKDLRQILREEPNGLDPVRVCDLMLQACAGLSEAHTAGIIHRDLKPSNLLVRKDASGREFLKILDLGLAKIVGGTSDLRTLTLVSAGVLVGTPAYMSPEQVNGANVDARTDLYALGVVLFELLTGRLPFESETVEGWLYQHLHAEPPMPSKIRPDLARYPGLDSTVLWCLAKAAHVRPARAEDLAFALRRLRDSTPGAALETDSGLLATPDPMSASYDTGMNVRPPTRIAPSSILQRPSTGQFVRDETALPQVQPPERREQFLAISAAAEDAEAREQWLQAVELWRQALPLADDRTSVNSRIEALQREISFEQVLGNASSFAAAGDWARAENALATAASLRPSDPRVDQARARLPQRLIQAWLEGARTRMNEFPEGESRQEQMHRLAMARARTADMDGAILLLQEESRDPGVRISGLAQAARAAIEAGHREGLRPYLDRALAAASTIPDAASRGRASLDVGRAMTVYGDIEAASKAFQSALAGYLAAGGQATASPTKSNPALESIWGSHQVTTTTRKLPKLTGDKEKSRDNALAAVAQAQAHAGLAEDALNTAGLIEDSWTLSLTLAQVAQELAKTGRSVEAERVAGQILFRLPRAKALRAVTVSRVYRGDMEGAETVMREIASPEERAPTLGFLAGAWARRGERARAERFAKEAYDAAMEVPAAVARIDALLNASEPLINAGHQTLASTMLAVAGRMIDGTEEPVERLHGHLRLARLRGLAQQITPATRSGLAAAVQGKTELNEVLRRAVGSLQRIVAQMDRVQCLESLAAAVGSANACDLAEQLLSQSRNEMERALIYVGLVAGIA